MNLQISQERESAALEKFHTALEGRAARSTNVVAAGESDVSGITTHALACDFASREQRYSARVDRQTDWTIVAVLTDKKARSYEALDRINSQPRIREPSLVGAVLRIAAGGLNAYRQHKKVNTN